MSAWIIQRKIFRSDWETLKLVEARTKAEAVKPFEYLTRNQSETYKLRAVSLDQAERDYQAGRSDNYKRVLEAV